MLSISLWIVALLTTEKDSLSWHSECNFSGLLVSAVFADFMIKYYNNLSYTTQPKDSVVNIFMKSCWAEQFDPDLVGMHL